MQAIGKYNEFDQRCNIFSLSNFGLNEHNLEAIKAQTNGVGCLISNKFLEIADSEEKYRLSSQAETLAGRLESLSGITLGEAEAYRNETSVGEATVFLIGKNLALTAAHAVCQKDSNLIDPFKLENTKLVFGYQLNNENQSSTEFDKKNIYKIKEVVAHNYEKQPCANVYKDWALIKLDRKIQELVPFNLDFSNLPKKGMEVHMLGFPLGLPMKYTGNGKVMKDPLRIEVNDESFHADLDAFRGNSGSPVINKKTNEVIGILSSGSDDFELDSNYLGTDNERLKTKKVTKMNIARHGWERCQRLDKLNFLKTYMERKSLPPETTDKAIKEMVDICNPKKLKLKEHSWGTKINNEGIPALIHCTSIKTLDLSHCDIERSGLEKLSKQLSNLSSLKTLDLSGNMITAEEVQELKLVMPNSEIEILH